MKKVILTLKNINRNTKRGKETKSKKKKKRHNIMKKSL